MGYSRIGLYFPTLKIQVNLGTWHGHMFSLLLLVGCVLPPSQLQIFWWGILTAWKKSNTFTVPAHLLVPWNQFMLLELQNPGSCNSIEGLVEYASWPNWLTYLVVIKSSMSDSDLGDWVTRWCEHQWPSYLLCPPLLLILLVMVMFAFFAFPTVPGLVKIFTSSFQCDIISLFYRKFSISSGIFNLYCIVLHITEV